LVSLWRSNVGTPCLSLFVCLLGQPTTPPEWASLEFMNAIPSNSHLKGEESNPRISCSSRQKFKLEKNWDSGEKPIILNYCWCTTYCSTSQRRHRQCSKDIEYMWTRPVIYRFTQCNKLPRALSPMFGAVDFLSCFSRRGWRIPKLITGLSWWCASDIDRFPVVVCQPSLRPTRCG